MDTIDAAIDAVDAATRDRAEEAYMQRELARAWLVVEASIRFPWATDDYRAAYVEMNVPRDPT